MKIIKPNSDQIPQEKPFIFLAGAEHWQTHVEKKFAKHPGTIYNPRRDDWNSNLGQSLDNPDFVHQVNWELDALEQSDVIMMYLDPATQSPITLLEFGKFYDSGKLVIACPQGFWRRGNLEVMCQIAYIPLRNSLDELIGAVELILPHYQ